MFNDFQFKGIVNDQLEDYKANLPTATQEWKQQQKQHILLLLQRRIPGNSSHLTAVLDPETDTIKTKVKDIAKVCTNWWQKTFDPKQINREKLRQWQSDYGKKFRVPARKWDLDKDKFRYIIEHPKKICTRS